MNILHISCSTRGHASESTRLSRSIVGLLLERNPSANLISRMISEEALAHIDADYAFAQHSATAEVALRGATLKSDELIQELEQSDVLVLGTPMHNMSVPSVLKAWIDHVVRAHRTFTVGADGKKGLLRDRPVFVAISSGGRYSGDMARQPDFLTPYLKAVLGMVGLRSLHVFSVQGTGMGPEVLAEARVQTDEELKSFFASNRL